MPRAEQTAARRTVPASTEGSAMEVRKGEIAKRGSMCSTSMQPKGDVGILSSKPKADAVLSKRDWILLNIRGRLNTG